MLLLLSDYSISLASLGCNIDRKLINAFYSLYSPQQLPLELIWAFVIIDTFLAVLLFNQIAAYGSK